MELFLNKKTEYLNKYIKNCDNSIENISEIYEKKQSESSIKDEESFIFRESSNKNNKIIMNQKYLKKSSINEIKNFFMKNALENKKKRLSILIPMKFMVKQATIEYVKKMKNNFPQFYFKNLSSISFIKKFVNLLKKKTFSEKITELNQNQINFINDLSFIQNDDKQKISKVQIFFF